MGSRSRRSRRWGARIAREAGSPSTQARAAPLRTRLLGHGEAEFVGHDVAGRLADTAGDGLLRALGRTATTGEDSRRSSRLSAPAAPDTSARSLLTNHGKSPRTAGSTVGRPTCQPAKLPCVPVRLLWLRPACW